MNRAELVDLVKKIMRAEGTADQIDEMVSAFEESVPHPEASGLIFWSNLQSAEEIVDAALAYLPLSVQPSSVERK